MDEERQNLRRQQSNHERIQINIRDTRLKKQIDLIRQHHLFELSENPDGSKDITFALSYKYVEKLPFIIHLSKDYPFQQPQYTFNPPDGFISKDDSDQKKLISDLLGVWSPGMRLSQIANKALQKIQKNLVSIRDIHQNLLYDLTANKKAFWIILAISLLVRLLVGLGGYSGQNDPPNYGDFEAQRNWMSIAYHRHPEKWYHETSQKPWWRLDYPPVAGYVSYLFAMIMKHVAPEGLAVKHGVESQALRLFMRMSVVISDVLLFYVPIVLYIQMLKLNSRVSSLILFTVLCVPAFILVDHGHFQYNCVMLGLVLFAFLGILNNQTFVACIFYTAALSTKQMAMYYALGFFSILLGKALFSSRMLNPNSYIHDFRRNNLIEFFTTVFSYAWIVIIVTIVLWLPWISLSNPGLIAEPLQAIFPVHRGLYQLKVPNFWCATDIFMKWETRFSSGVLLSFCAVLSLLGSVPSMIVSCLVPRPKLYLYALMNISLSFFFFSFHVHQKTVLVPLLFVVLNISNLGSLAFDFIMLSSFCMYHLLREDGQTLQYFVVNLAYLYFGRLAVIALRDVKFIKDEEGVSPVDEREEGTKQSKMPMEIHHSAKLMGSLAKSLRSLYNKLLRMPIYVCMAVLHICDATVTPPEKLPYLWHLLFSLLAFLVFLYVFVYSNLQMISEGVERIQRTISKCNKKD